MGAASLSQADAQKKSQRAAEQDRADIADARQQWRTQRDEWRPDNLVFVDETGASTKMTIEAGSGEELHTAVVDARGHAKAVEFDLVHPLRACGGFWTGWESWGGTNRARVASRRDRPDLTAETLNA